MSICQGLCSYDGELYGAWKGEVGDDRLFYSHFNGTKWATQGSVAGNSSVGPALAVFGDSMYAAWKGEHSDERVFFTKLSGSSWMPQTQIPGVASSGGPSLAHFGGKLYAAWKGSGSDESLWYASYDGSKWSAQAQIPSVASSIGPSLSGFSGELYAAWKGSANDQRLWYATFDGSGWSAQAQIPVAVSSVGPSLAAFGGKLYAAWKGDSSDQNLYYASYDGSGWSAQAQIPGVASSIGPALAKFNGDLYAMWKASDGDQNLWYASFDGTKWSAQAIGPGNTGQDLPQNIGLRMQYQETKDWCWIAVATSVNHFYNPSSTATQCGIMTTVGQAINGFSPSTSACPDAAHIASDPGLAAILADPYTETAHNVLDNPSLGIPTEYIKTGGVADALNVHGNWNGPRLSSITLAQINTEIGAGRPIAVDIKWKSKGAHCVAIAGVLNDMLLICDPIFGETVIQYELFPTAYRGGASLENACLTKKGS
ncbi:MAG: hypothetical protein WAJ87_04580 [Bryobacteraceae bacterium]